jgi:hypothetical protein
MNYWRRNGSLQITRSVEMFCVLSPWVERTSITPLCSNFRKFNFRAEFFVKKAFIYFTLKTPCILSQLLFKNTNWMYFYFKKLYSSLKHYNKTQHMFRLLTEPSSGVFLSLKLHLFKNVYSLVHFVNTVLPPSLLMMYTPPRTR